VPDEHTSSTGDMTDAAEEHLSELIRSTRTAPAIGPMLASASDAAIDEFDRTVLMYCQELAREVTLWEIGNRARGVGRAEITATDVVHGADAVRKNWSTKPQRKPSGYAVALEGATPIFALAAGVAGSYLHAGWQVGLFTGLAVLAAIGTIMLVVMAWRRK